MYEFSQKIKTFYLNLCATKFDPNLLASHLKFHTKLKSYKIIFELGYKSELLLFLGFILDIQLSEVRI
jgi:hypothetical protein